MRRTERVHYLARFVFKKGLVDPRLPSLLGERAYYRELKTCALGGAAVSVGEFLDSPEGANGMVQFSKTKGKVRASVYIKMSDGFAKENMKYIDDIIFELFPGTKRVYIVRSPNYEGVAVAERIWRWLTAGHSTKGALYYLEITAPGRLGKKLLQRALESGAFSYNGCSDRLETNIVKKRKELEKFARETKVWEDNLFLCKFHGKCQELGEVLA